jgi:hypothetical protein
MVNQELAGKPKFAQIASKYAVVQPIQDKDKKEELPVNETNQVSSSRPEIDKSNIEKHATNFNNAIQDTIDHSIKKRKHPAYKGERIPRTFKIPMELDERMHEVYEKEGIEMQAQMAKALKSWLDENYPEESD